MSECLIQSDTEELDKRQEIPTLDGLTDSIQWHLLHKFRGILTKQNG